MRTATLVTLVGMLLILVGLLVPSSAVIASLRATPVDAELNRQLLIGAALFRTGFVVLGALALVVVRLPLGTATTFPTRRDDANRPLVLASLGAILATGIALRLHRLDSGLWYDEIVMYLTYMTRSAGEIVTSYDLENQHTLFTLLAHLSSWLFGDSAWSLRLPAALFGVASIWGVYLLGRQVGTTREGLLAAALLSCSYHHIWFSQSARGYTALLFWTVFTSWLLLRALHEARPQLWILYAIAVALGAYTHLTMLFVVLSHFVIYLVSLAPRRHRLPLQRDWWLGLVLGFCLAALLTLQLYALILPQIPGTIDRTVSTVASWKSPFWTLRELLSGVTITFAGGAVALAAVVVFGAGMVSVARTNPAIICMLLLPTTICTILIVARGHHLWPRFFFFTMGFGAIIVVRGTLALGEIAARLLRVSPTHARTFGTALGAALVAASALSVPRAFGPKQDYAGAQTFVDQSRQPGDAVVTAGLAVYPYQSFYKTDWNAVTTVDELNAVRSHAKRTWLLYTLPTHLRDVHPDIAASLERDFVVIKQFYGTLGGGTVYVSRADSPPDGSTNARLN